MRHFCLRLCSFRCHSVWLLSLVIVYGHGDTALGIGAVTSAPTASSREMAASVGVTVAVVSHADDGRLRGKGGQEILLGAVFGSVMAHHKDLQIRQVVLPDQRQLRLPGHIARNKQVKIAAAAQVCQSLLVGIARAHGRENREAALPQGMDCFSVTNST